MRTFRCNIGSHQGYSDLDDFDNLKIIISKIDQLTFNILQILILRHLINSIHRRTE